jgi:anti-sigma factor RsiW
VTLHEVHLAEEAVVAYVDGLLSPSAAARAERHLVGCAECCADVAAQREMRSFLRGSGGPALPTGLMSRLLDVPMTADLGSGPLDAELVVDGDRIGWAAPTRRAPSGPRLVERTRTVEPVGAGAPIGAMAAVARRPVAAAPSSRPSGSSGPGRPAVGMPRRLRRHRRGLAVSLAGLAFGVIASAAATGTPGAAGPAPGTVVPGQPPTQITVGGNPLQATTFSFNRSSGRSALVATNPRGR